MEWWILGYFFLGGLAGGSYALGTCCGSQAILATRRRPAGLYRSFIALIPARSSWPRPRPADPFWHMLVDNERRRALAQPRLAHVGRSWCCSSSACSPSSLPRSARRERPSGRRATIRARSAAGPASSGVHRHGARVFICGYTGSCCGIESAGLERRRWVLGGMFWPRRSPDPRRTTTVRYARRRARDEREHRCRARGQRAPSAPSATSGAANR